VMVSAAADSGPSAGQAFTASDPMLMTLMGSGGAVLAPGNLGTQQPITVGVDGGGALEWVPGVTSAYLALQGGRSGTVGQLASGMWYTLMVGGGLMSAGLQSALVNTSTGQLVTQFACQPGTCTLASVALEPVAVQSSVALPTWVRSTYPWLSKLSAWQSVWNPAASSVYRVPYGAVLGTPWALPAATVVRSYDPLYWDSTPGYFPGVSPYDYDNWRSWQTRQGFKKDIARAARQRARRDRRRTKRRSKSLLRSRSTTPTGKGRGRSGSRRRLGAVTKRSPAGGSGGSRRSSRSTSRLSSRSTSRRSSRSRSRNRGS